MGRGTKDFGFCTAVCERRRAQLGRSRRGTKEGVFVWPMTGVGDSQYSLLFQLYDRQMTDQTTDVHSRNPST